MRSAATPILLQLAELRDREADLLRELAKVHEMAPRVGAYDSEHLPPLVRSSRAFAKRCRAIPEARRSARGWSCPRAAWHADAERRAQLRRRSPLKKAARPTTSNVISLAQRIVADAARPTRGAR